MLTVKDLRFRSILSVAIASLILIAVVQPVAIQLKYLSAQSNDPRYNNTNIVPKNIILLIGDGMGINHIRLTELVFGKLNITIIPNIGGTIGLALTFSLISEIPDSAAAGTAIATGFLTDNRFISMVPTEEGVVIPVPTIAEIAKKLGKSVGLVTTTRITHATPAVFAAHVPHRDYEDLIALQYIENEVADVLLGGGARYFNETIISLALSRNWHVVKSRSELLSVDPKSISKLLGLFASSHIPYVLDRDGDIPNLVEMTAKAIEILEKNPNGFFLMIEGGRIDHAAHANDVASVVWETKEFDDVIGYVVEYAAKKGDTLVIITADHETGGLALSGLLVGDLDSYNWVINKTAILSIKKSVEYMFNLIRRGHDPRLVILNYTGIAIKDDEVDIVKESAVGLARVISSYIGVTWGSTQHTAQPTIVIAYGPGSELFKGYYHQRDLAKKMMQIMLFGLSANKDILNSNTYRALALVGERADGLALALDYNGNGLVDLEDVYYFYRIEFGTASAPVSNPVSNTVVVTTIAVLEPIVYPITLTATERVISTTTVTERITVTTHTTYTLPTTITVEAIDIAQVSVIGLTATSVLALAVIAIILSKRK